jgi:hypothetical protein
MAAVGYDYGDCTAVRNQKQCYVRRSAAGDPPVKVQCLRAYKGTRINWHNASKRWVGIHIAKRTA